jgi:pimeloyl-ACP methyl ester carboxylesterase
MSAVTAIAARRFGSVVDRAVLALMKRPGRYPLETDYVRLQAEFSATHAIYAKNGLLSNPIGFHTAPAPLLWPAIRRIRRRGLWLERLSFGSDYRVDPLDRVGARWLRYQRNRTAHAYVARTQPSAPWLICLHGLGTGSPVLDLPVFRARKLRDELGYNLMFPTLPLHGARRERGMSREALLSFELIETLHGLAQAARDVRRLMGWARTQGAQKIGLYGLSMGAYVAALVAALEPADFVLAAIPFSDIPALFSSHGTPHVRERAAHFGVLGDDLLELYSLVSPLTIPSQVPHDRRFIVAGRSDQVTTPVQAEKLWDAWERPTIRWFDGGHISFFWSAQARRQVDRALRTLSERSTA